MHLSLLATVMTSSLVLSQISFTITFDVKEFVPRRAFSAVDLLLVLPIHY